MGHPPMIQSQKIGTSNEDKWVGEVIGLQAERLHLVIGFQGEMVFMPCSCEATNDDVESVVVGLG